MNMPLQATILAAIDSGKVSLPDIAQYIGRPAHHLTQTLVNLRATGVLARDGVRRQYRYYRPTTPQVPRMISSIWDLAATH